METNDNKNLSKAKLLAEVARLKKELKKSKKYGLVWEEKLEDVVELCKEKLPILKEVKNKEIETDKTKPVNLLIEGDNYHALSVLNYTHSKKIDVIYIDPPYNTGSKDFIFNDLYVDREDAYRHSKWLAFMEKRLKLAKYLLKDTGAIFISIDDNEVAQLKLLMDDKNIGLFGEDNFVAILVWENREGGGSSDSKHFKIKHEYVLVYAKNKPKFLINKEKIPDEDAYTYTDKYEKERGKHKLIKLNSASIQYSKSLDYPIIAPDRKEIWPSFKHKKACWRWSKEKVKWGLANGFIKIDKNKSGNWVVYSKQYLNVDNENNPIERQRPPFAVISQYSSTMATKELEKMFHGKVFSYPKPYLLIKYLLNLSTEKNSVILDFMAGTGTTSQAVLELNKEDNGNRQFILCTNNENDIATNICYPRVKKVIMGYENLKGEKIKGLGGILKYFKTDFVDGEPTDKNKIKLTAEATEMLCVKEGTFKPVLAQNNYKIFKNTDHYTGIIYDPLAISVFKKVIKNFKGKFSVYIFSLGDETFDEEFEDIKQKVRLSPIPEAILRVYRRIFK
ncbi:MAG: site-specific DNA-methyltransferase [Patescibacteria group bacterium]|nr:site-specific DNA-methyltransferase [Patescibacteria group bacterium]